MTNKSPIKKIVKYSFATLLVLVIIVIAAPFLVDFSKFKPQIQEAVSSAVDAKLDFESARLQLFPSIGIKLSGVSIENTAPDFAGVKMFAVDSVVVNTGLIALLNGHVEGQVTIVKPEFILAKKGIKSNVTSLVKPAKPNPASAGNPSPAAATNPTEKPAQQSATEKSEQIAMLKDRVLIKGVHIKDAQVIVKDMGQSSAQTKEPVKIRDLNIEITNIGLDRDINVAMATKMQIEEAGAKITGPIGVQSTVHVKLNASGLEDAKFSGKLSFDDLGIYFKTAFAKAPGIPLNLQFDGNFKPEDFTLQNLQFNFHTLKVDSSAHIVNFADPKIDFKLTAANNSLSALGDVLPEHKAMLLAGTLKTELLAQGTVSKLDAFAVKFLFDTHLANTDLAMNVDAHGVYPFKGQILTKSQRIDVDGLLKPFSSNVSNNNAGNKNVQDLKTAQPSAATTPTTAANGSTTATSSATSSASTTSQDFSLTPEQKKLIMGTDAEIRTDLQEIVYSGLKLTRFKLDLDQKNLIGTLKQFNIDGFGGRIAAQGRINLDDAPITFDGSFKMQDIHLEQVMLVVKPEYKDVLVGRMNLDVNVKGRGTTLTTLNKTLNGGGAFKFNEGQLNTPSIAAKMQEQFDSFVDSLASQNIGDGIIGSAKKLLDNPLVKASGKTPPDLDQVKERFKAVTKVKIAQKAPTSRDLKDVSGKIDIKDGKIYILSQKTDGSGSMDVKSFVDLELNLGGGAVYTASEQTKASLMAQSKYANVFFDDKNNLVLNLTLSGTVMDPKVGLSTDSLRENFKKKAQSLLEREAKQAAEDYIKGLLGGAQAKEAAKAKLEEEARKREAEAKAKAQEEIDKNKDKAKDAAKDALKGLWGK